MTRSILLTAAIAALTALNSSTAAPQDATVSRGQISEDLLAQFGLDGSATVSDAEGTEIRGKAIASSPRVVNIKPEGQRRGRKTIRRVTKRNRFVAKRLKPGRYTVRYRAVAKRGKKTVAKTGPSAPTRVSVPGRSVGPRR